MDGDGIGMKQFVKRLLAPQAAIEEENAVFKTRAPRRRASIHNEVHLRRMMVARRKRWGVIGDSVRG